MKYFILIGYLLIVSVAQGQQIINGDFEDYNLTSSCLQSITTNNTQGGLTAPFQEGCLNGYVWGVSHGTPELRSTGDPANPRSNVYALLLTGQGYGRAAEPTDPVLGEGIYYNCNFKQGQVYKISLKIATYPSSDPTYTLDKVVIGLTNGLVGNTSTSQNFLSGLYNIPNVPTFNIETLVNVSYPISNGWHTVEEVFIPDANYTQLWIYPYDYVNSTNVLFVDNISVTSCLPNVTYNTTTSLPKLIKTVDYITNGPLTQVLSGQDVTFQAGNYISLQPGFWAVAGSKFTARIAPCSDDACDIPFGRRGFEDNMNSFENLENLLSIYPNPAEDEVTVKFPFPFSKDIRVTLLDVFGKTMTESTILMDGDEFKVDIRGMKKGMYFIKVDVEGKSVVKRIMVN